MMALLSLLMAAVVLLGWGWDGDEIVVKVKQP